MKYAILHRMMLLLLLIAWSSRVCAQQQTPSPSGQTGKAKSVFLTPATVYEGDTIPYVKLPTVYVFKPMKFKNKRQERQYNKLVRDVKKVLPIAKECRAIILETYDYLETLPNKEARDRHMKRVEQSIKEEYTPRMKKLTYQQGKLLIKLIYRECNSSSYNLIQAFFGQARAGVYQAFAWLFGASLRKEYDPNGVDRLTERIVRQIESGQL